MMDGTELDDLIRRNRLEPLVEPLARLVQSSLTAELVVKLAMAYGIHAAHAVRSEGEMLAPFRRILHPDDITR